MQRLKDLPAVEQALMKCEQLEQALLELTDDHRRLVNHVNSLGDTINKLIAATRGRGLTRDEEVGPTPSHETKAGP